MLIGRKLLRVKIRFLDRIDVFRIDIVLAPVRRERSG
jgi:hypothetical protein